MMQLSRFIARLKSASSSSPSTSFSSNSTTSSSSSSSSSHGSSSSPTSSPPPASQWPTPAPLSPAPLSPAPFSPGPLSPTPLSPTPLFPAATSAYTAATLSHPAATSAHTAATFSYTAATSAHTAATFSQSAVTVMTSKLRRRVSQNSVEGDAGVKVDLAGSGVIAEVSGSGRVNNNDEEPEDLQLSRESRPVQPKSCSMSTTSRSSMRSEQFTDDTSSISAKSDASVDSLVFDANFGAIRPDLYPRKDIVLQQSSLDSGHGRLHTRLKYDFRTCDLVVHLIEAQDLPAPDPVTGQFSDPYIRLSLVPCVDERVRQSSVKRKTLNPYFNEYFKFPLDFDDLKEKTLVFHLYDYDKFSRHTAMGEVEVGMDTVDLSNSVEMWCDIQKQHKVVGECGEVLISLSYLPTAERLTVVVMKAKELKLSTAAPSADPFVRVSLMVEGKKIKRKKTSVRRGSVNPVWNEALAFNVPAEVLPKVSLEVCILDHDLLGHGELLGRCLLGGGANRQGEEHVHWKDMMSNQRKSVAMWHVLRK